PVGARGSGGGGDLIVFETDRDVFVAPAEIAELHSQEPGGFRALATENLLPFGRRARPGRAFYLGLDGPVAPGPQVALGFGVLTPPGEPPPVGLGGGVELPVPPSPLLRWEILDGGPFQPAELVRDETSRFVRSGVVELRVSPSWRPGRPVGLGGDT